MEKRRGRPQKAIIETQQTEVIMTDKSKPDNAYRVKLSGTYTVGDDVLDFYDLTGYIPANTETIVAAAAVKRYATMWLKIKNKGKVNVSRIREVFVDEMTPCRHEFSYAGKDIRNLSLEELQDVAVAYDLREAPLYKTSSLLASRKKVYGLYCKYILEEATDTNAESFSLQQAKPAILEADDYQDNTLVRAIAQDHDARTKSPEQELDGISREKLFGMAQRMGIKVPDNARYEQVYKLVFA
jgi:hypothetical protein